MARVKFKLVALRAKEVLPAGDFTDWATHPKKMKRTRPHGRTYETTVSLPTGRCEYKFIVDGEWIEDPKAAAEPNCYGTVNSACEVE